MSDTFNEFLNRLEKPDKLCPWSIYMFAMEIAQRRGLGGEYIRKHIRIVDNNTLKTDLYAPDDYCIASISFLYCGKPQPDGLRSPVPWNDVTTDMVNTFLDELANEFADYIHQTYVCGLIDSEPRNEGEKVSIINLAINQITEPEKSLSSKDRWVQQGRCYLVAFHKVPVESDLSRWTQTVVSAYTGTKLFKDIQQQLEQKFSSPFVIDTISDLGPETP